jgi:sugar lactone lactonase YvrE
LVAPLSDLVDASTFRMLTGGGASEGPLWHPEGYLTFVRFELSQLLRWDPNRCDAVVVRTETGKGNGCTLDSEGRLLMCEGDHRRVTRTESDGTITTIAEHWLGRRLHRPNDVVCRSDGLIYFSDPSARRDPAEREIDFSGVYVVTPEGDLGVGTDECEYPNGLAFSPDESVMYVAITRRDEGCLEEGRRGELCSHRRIRVFDVEPGGQLTGNRIFADMSSTGRAGPDGIKVDTEGRVYCTGEGGIWVFEPSGVRIGVIPVPERPRNLAFGGTGFTTLFVTAGNSLYSVETNARGIGAFTQT